MIPRRAKTLTRFEGEILAKFEYPDNKYLLAHYLLFFTYISIDKERPKFLPSITDCCELIKSYCDKTVCPENMMAYGHLKAACHLMKSYDSGFNYSPEKDHFARVIQQLMLYSRIKDEYRIKTDANCIGFHQIRNGDYKSNSSYRLFMDMRHDNINGRQCRN